MLCLRTFATTHAHLPPSLAPDMRQAVVSRLSPTRALVCSSNSDTAHYLAFLCPVTPAAPGVESLQAIVHSMDGQMLSINSEMNQQIGFPPAGSSFIGIVRLDPGKWFDEVPTAAGHSCWGWGSRS